MQHCSFHISVQDTKNPQSIKAGKEPGLLGELRTKLLFLLETSTQYQSMKLLRYFPTDGEFVREYITH